MASTGQGFTGTNMFAYCLNNPACYEDSTGNYALSFYQRVHKSVQEKCAALLGGGLTEVCVYTNGKKGFLDIYIPLTNEFYEVKSSGAATKNSTNQQIDRYKNSTIYDKHPLAGGKNPVAGSQRVAGCFIMEGHLITYYNTPDKPELIIYEIHDIPDEAYTASGLLSIASIMYALEHFTLSPGKSTVPSGGGGGVPVNVGASGGGLGGSTFFDYGGGGGSSLYLYDYYTLCK